MMIYVNKSYCFILIPEVCEFSAGNSQVEGGHGLVFHNWTFAKSAAAITDRENTALILPMLRQLSYKHKDATISFKYQNPVMLVFIGKL